MVLRANAAGQQIPSNGRITNGGTYTGDHVGTVAIATNEEVVINGATIRSSGDQIRVEVSDADLEVRNSTLRGTHPGAEGRLAGYAVLVPSGKAAGRLVIEHNDLISNGGVLLRGWNHGQDDETFKLRYNRQENCNGMTSTASGWSQTNKVSLQHRFSGNKEIHNVPGFEIAWNVIKNDYGSSACEDHISMYNSGGNANNPYRIHHNLIDGAYPAGPHSSGYSGGGIITDGTPQSGTALTDQYVYITNNTVLDSMNYGQKITQGHHNKLNNNVSVRDGKSSDGQNYLDDRALAPARAFALQNKKGTSYFGAHEVSGNRAGWAGGGEFGIDTTQCHSPCVAQDNQTVPETTAQENAARADYYAEARAAGITFGPESTPPPDTGSSQAELHIWFWFSAVFCAVLPVISYLLLTSVPSLASVNTFWVSLVVLMLPLAVGFEAGYFWSGRHPRDYVLAGVFVGSLAAFELWVVFNAEADNHQGWTKLDWAAAASGIAVGTLFISGVLFGDMYEAKTSSETSPQPRWSAAFVAAAAIIPSDAKESSEKTIIHLLEALGPATIATFGTIVTALLSAYFAQTS